MIRRAAVVVCALAFIGCSSDAAPRSNGSSGSGTTTTTTAPTTTTTVVLAPAGTPEEAARAFVNAWHDADQIAALTIALPAAVDAVFTAGEPGSLENRGCNRQPADSPVRCVYRTGLGELVLVVQPRPDGWIVEQALLSAA